MLGTNDEINYHLYIKCLRRNKENVNTIKATGIDKKSDYKIVQFCDNPHFLNVTYEQDSLAYTAMDFVSGWKN